MINTDGDLNQAQNHDFIANCYQKRNKTLAFPQIVARTLVHQGLNDEIKMPTIGKKE